MLMQYLSEGKIAIGKHVTMEAVDSDKSYHQPEPTLCIDMTAAQVLMDDLWRAGLRPTEGSGSAGSLAATERHLKDLQKLVFEGNPTINRASNNIEVLCERLLHKTAPSATSPKQS
jgi:hypothetical protein